MRFIVVCLKFTSLTMHSNVIKWLILILITKLLVCLNAKHAVTYTLSNCWGAWFLEIVQHQLVSYTSFVLNVHRNNSNSHSLYVCTAPCQKGTTFTSTSSSSHYRVTLNWNQSQMVSRNFLRANNSIATFLKFSKPL